MFDISAAGAHALIKFGDGTEIDVTQFSDEGTPFESPDVTLSTNAKNLQGTMISSRTPSVIPVSITVVPGSYEDYWLQIKAGASLLMPGGIIQLNKITVKTITLYVPAINGSFDITTGNKKNVNTFTWANGRMVSAPTGPSTSAEGRQRARTYSFEFEKFMPPKSSAIRL